MPSVFDGEDEARLYRMVERILRQLPRDNYTQGRGRVAETDVVVRRLATTSAGAAPAADIDGAPVGGDLTGTLPNPTVDGLQGNAVGTAAPTDGQVLTWGTANSEWAPADASGGATALAELDDVGTATPTDGQVLTYSTANAQWEPDDAASGGGGATIGTATVASGATTGTAAHGLGFNPLDYAFQLTPTSSWGSATEYWISSSDATNLVVAVDTAPGTAVNFAWAHHGTAVAADPFAPGDLDNQLAWWDFTELGLANDAAVGTATDQWGNADLIQTNAANKPVYKTNVKNGLSAAYWSDEDEYMDSQALSQGSLPMSYWAVVNLEAVPTGSTDDNFIIDFDLDAGLGVGAALWADAGTDSWWIFNGSSVSGGTLATGWHRIIVVYRSTSDASLWVDGTEYTGSPGTRDPSDSPTVGSRADGPPDDSWDGHIAEIGVVGDALTSQEISDLDAYLVDKYDL